MSFSGGGVGKVGRRFEEFGEKGRLAAVVAAAGGGCGGCCAESGSRAWVFGRAGLGVIGRVFSGIEMVAFGFRGRARLGAGGRIWEISMLVGKVVVRMILFCCTVISVTMGLSDIGLVRRKLFVGEEMGSGRGVR